MGFGEIARLLCKEAKRAEENRGSHLEKRSKKEAKRAKVRF
jgi:hypothetical protein